MSNQQDPYGFAMLRLLILGLIIIIYILVKYFSTYSFIQQKLIFATHIDNFQLSDGEIRTLKENDYLY